MRILICSAEDEAKKLAAFAARSLSAYGAVELVADSAFSRSAKRKALDSFVYFDSSIGQERILELAFKLVPLLSQAQTTEAAGKQSYGNHEQAGDQEDQQ